MARDRQVIKQGTSTMTVDMRPLVAIIDRVSDGAGSTFIDETTRVLRAIRGTAVDRWPRYSGKSAESFDVQPRITRDTIAVSLANTARSGRWGAYAYRIRWSVRTKESLDREARTAAARGKTPEARHSIYRFVRGGLQYRHGDGAPDAALAGKQPWRVLVRQPANKQQRDLLERLQRSMTRLAQGATP